VSQDGGTFTLTADPAAVSGQTPGEFSLTFVASDGVSLSSATSAFTLVFSIGPGNPGSLTLDSSYDTVATLGVAFDYVIAGEPGVVFGINSTDGSLFGVYALDVSDPTSVSLLSYFKPTGMVSGVLSGAAYSANRLAFSAADRLVCVDVSDPSTMSEMFTKVGSDGIAGFTGDHVLMTENPGGFRTLDMSGAIVDTVTPVGFASNCKTPFQHPSNYEGDLFAVYTTDTGSGRRALLAEVSAACAITITDPFSADPSSANLSSHVGTFDGSTLLYAVNSSGQSARLFDVSNPAAPLAYTLPEVSGDVTVGQSGLTRQWYSGAAYLDGYAYLTIAAGAEQYRVFDAQDPANPSGLGLIQSSLIPNDIAGPGKLPTFSGGRMFASADLDATLRVLK